MCALFCAVLPYGALMLERTVVVAGRSGLRVRRQQAPAERGDRDACGARLLEAEKAAEKAREEERHADRQRFPRWPAAELHQPADAAGDPAQADGARSATPAWTDLKQLQALAQSQVRDLRTFLHSMRPVDVDGANLVATARRAAESFQKESGIPVTFLGTNRPVGLPPETTLEVLQMLREALHNVQKHAGATRVAVAMEKTDRGLEISVDDNGHGFGFAGSYSLEELELLRWVRPA